MCIIWMCIFFIHTNGHILYTLSCSIFLYKPSLWNLKSFPVLFNLNSYILFHCVVILISYWVLIYSFHSFSIYLLFTLYLYARNSSGQYRSKKADKTPNLQWTYIPLSFVTPYNAAYKNILVQIAFYAYGSICVDKYLEIGIARSKHVY